MNNLPPAVEDVCANMRRLDEAIEQLEYRLGNAPDKRYTFTLKERAAVRRASMDLTRSLAEMRKPGAMG